MAAVLVWRFGRGREPTYEGKTVTQWLDTMKLVPGQFDFTTDPAVAAIRALGTNAIPMLVHHIKSTSDNAIGLETYAGLREKMGPAGAYLPDKTSLWDKRRETTYRRRAGAALGLMALGPEHQAGVPRIFDVVSSLTVTNSKEKWAMVTVASSFRFTGAKDTAIITDLLGGLQNARAEVRLVTLWALGALERPPASAFPMLTNFAADPQQRFRGLAIALLPRVGKDRPELVGLLATFLTDSSQRDVQLAAIAQLRQLGTDALPALPLLEQAAEDPDPFVSKSARATVEHIKNLRDQPPQPIR